MAETITRTLPAQFIEDLGRDYGTQIAALTSLPVDTTKFAPQVAAQDPLQAAAYAQAIDPTKGLGAFQPFLTKATTAADATTPLTGTGAGTGAGSIQSYMSPYQQQVIDTTLTEFDRNRAIQEQSIRDQQAQLGVLGAGRAGVQLAEYGSGADRERALLQAGLLQQGFGQAQQSAQQALANQLGLAGAQQQFSGAQQGLAGQQFGQAGFQTGLSNFLQSSRAGDIQALGGLGSLRQGITQAQLTADQQAAQAAAFEPQQRLQQYGAGLGQVAGFGAQAPQLPTEAVNPLDTALGTALGVGGLYAKIFAKPQVVIR